MIGYARRSRVLRAASAALLWPSGFVGALAILSLAAFVITTALAASLAAALTMKPGDRANPDKGFDATITIDIDSAEVGG